MPAGALPGHRRQGLHFGWQGTDLPHYNVPHYVSEGVREHRGMRVQAFRGIGSGHNKFAIGGSRTRDRAERKVDPLELRLALTREDARAQAALREVADVHRGRKRPGRGMGIAFADYHGSISAWASPRSPWTATAAR